MSLRQSYARLKKIATIVIVIANDSNCPSALALGAITSKEARLT
jgi:hypothetical protein